MTGSKAEDVQIVPYIDRTDLVAATVDKVPIPFSWNRSGLSLFYSWGSPRSALVVGATIPFAMMVAFILMYSQISRPTCCRWAPSISDHRRPSIVTVDAILRRREANPNEPLSEDDAREAASQVARPISSRLSLSSRPYLPLFAFQRVEASSSTDGLCGRFCAARCAVVCIGRGPWTGLPRLSQPRRIFRNRVLEWLEIHYAATLQHFLGRPRHHFLD